MWLRTALAAVVIAAAIVAGVPLASHADAPYVKQSATFSASGQLPIINLQGQSSCSYAMSGGGSATITPKGSSDSGTTYSTISSAGFGAQTSNGVYGGALIPSSGAPITTNFFVAVTGVSGSVVVTEVCSGAVSARGSGGGTPAPASSVAAGNCIVVTTPPPQGTVAVGGAGCTPSPLFAGTCTSPAPHAGGIEIDIVAPCPTGAVAATVVSPSPPVEVTNPVAGQYVVGCSTCLTATNLGIIGVRLVSAAPTSNPSPQPGFAQLTGGLYVGPAPTPATTSEPFAFQLVGPTSTTVSWGTSTQTVQGIPGSAFSVSTGGGNPIFTVNGSGAIGVNSDEELFGHLEMIQGGPIIFDGVTAPSAAACDLTTAGSESGFLKIHQVSGNGCGLQLSDLTNKGAALCTDTSGNIYGSASGCEPISIVQTCFGNDILAGSPTSSVTCTLPATATAGDTLLALITVNAGSGTSTITGPSGYTAALGPTTPASANVQYAVYNLTATGSETAVTATLSVAEIWNLTLIELKGAHTLDANAVSATTVTNGSLPFPSFTPSAGSIVFYFGTWRVSNGNCVFPPNVTSLAGPLSDSTNAFNCLGIYKGQGTGAALPIINVAVGGTSLAANNAGLASFSFK